MIRILITFTLLLLLIQPLSAQEKTSERRSALGINVSNIAGIGLSLRGHLGDATTAQVTGGILSVNDNTSYSLGGELLYRVARMEGMDVPIGPAIGMYGDSDTDTNVRIGLGLGIDYRTSENLSSNYFLVTVRLYYPAVYTQSGNVTFGGGVGLLVAF